MKREGENEEKDGYEIERKRRRRQDEIEKIGGEGGINLKR